MIKLKWVVIFEAVIILILLAFIIYSHYNKNPNPEGLLSQRIYAGLIEPKSFMIITFAPLKEKIQAFITQNNQNVSVYVENFRNGAFMGINEKTGFFPTSLNKLPVAILIMKKIEQGELNFDSMIKLNEENRVESYGDLYKSEKNEFPLRFVLEKMLKESDNTALSMLLDQLNLDDLQFLLDYYDIDIKVHKTKGIEEDLITPKAMSNLFRSIYFSTVLNPEDSEYLLSLLTSTTFDIKTIAKLPDNVKVTQKFGVNYYNNNQFFHDCGIIYIDESRIFYCVMTKDLSEEEATKTIGLAVNEIYNYVVDAKAKFEKMKE